jgi:peptide-methionine (R)-S-oxide reductase
MKNPQLSKEQQQVLFEKATEVPFSGALLYTHDDGDYACANCNAPLFHSDNKFDSSSGWPSFDQAIDNAVVFTTDTEFGMVRTEITCATCGGHLGHMFDDGPKNTTGLRYCVNSLSLDFKKK